MTFGRATLVTSTVVVVELSPVGLSVHHPLAVTVSVPATVGVRMNCPTYAGATVATLPNPAPEYW